MAINWKNGNDKFSQWFRFQVNIITAFGVMKIFFYKGLTRNPEIEKPPSESSLISEDWGERHTKFGTYVSNDILLNAAKYQGYSFYVSELLRENQQGMGVKLPILRLAHPD